MVAPARSQEGDCGCLPLLVLLVRPRKYGALLGFFGELIFRLPDQEEAFLNQKIECGSCTNKCKKRIKHNKIKQIKMVIEKRTNRQTTRQTQIEGTEY